MRIYSLLLSILLFCCFGTYRLSFDVVKKSGKEFQKQNGKSEFYFLGDKIDTTRSIFVAEVKLKGEDVTLVNIYAKLRQESQKLGANSFQVVNKAKGDDSFYLLCNIFLTDSATLRNIKTNDPDNGKIFILSPEPVGYLNKDKVSVNDSLKFVLISGSYRAINIKQENETYKIICGRSIIQFTGKKDQVKYIAARQVKYNTSQTVSSSYVYGGVATAKGASTAPIEINKKVKGNILEAALGKLMLLFYKPADTK
ncbi:MAG: hypothetical protein ACHQHP_04360 [Bacteroidia bacterium]